MWDTATIVTISGAAASAVTAILTVVIVKSADAYAKRKQADADAWKIMQHGKFEECEADDDRADRAYKAIMKTLNDRVSKLEVELEKSHNAERQCLEMNARLTERLDHQSRRIASLEKKLEGHTN